MSCIQDVGKYFKNKKKLYWILNQHVNTKVGVSHQGASEVEDNSHGKKCTKKMKWKRLLFYVGYSTSKLDLIWQEIELSYR